MAAHRAGGAKAIKARLNRPVGWWDDAATCEVVEPIGTHLWYTRPAGSLPRFASIELPPEAMKKLMAGGKLQVVVVDVTETVTDEGAKPAEVAK